MTEKEIGELRRRYRKDRSNISRVSGCFVNEKKEIISRFDQSLGLMSEDDADGLLSVLKKTLSGNIGRNLYEINFSAAAAAESENHKLLTKLRDSELHDGEAAAELYEKIISSYEYDGNFVILLAHDKCDVYSYTADGEKNESGTVFSYIVCAVCPVRSGRAALSFYLPGNCFRTVCADTMLGAPEFGFSFPAYRDGGADIYGALYYTRNLKDSYSSVVDALFSTDIPMPPAEQKGTFGEILRDAMEEDCSMKVVRSVYSQVNRMIAEHKEQKIEEPLVMRRDDVSDMLRYVGVPEDRVTVFEEKFTSEFGEHAEINPKNITETSLKVKTPEVTIKVNPGHTDLIDTKIIDGVKYIMIRADDAEVNGVDIVF